MITNTPLRNSNNKSLFEGSNLKRFALVMVLAAMILAVIFHASKNGTTTLAAGSSSIVISQVYGGAGCGTAGCSTYKNDYIELFNRGASPVSLNGWSVQYAAAAGTTWQVTNLGNVTLQPGQYYLVAESLGANGVNNLPTADATGTIAMSATAGKVALINTTTASSGACPASASIVDLVGYGSTASCNEGGANAPAPSTTIADIRAGGGCTDTDSNSTDFAAASPTPRNTSSATNTCATPTNPSGSGSSSPSTVIAGGTTLLTVAVTPGLQALELQPRQT